ncbi:hypothetical protein ACGRHY_00705 [Streptomyces sp. HK10]|uniref:hypothetical protein n=1 Tax=Streptomyces sp. HK10 TaxID=3373255 RepID=UPI003748382A
MVRSQARADVTAGQGVAAVRPVRDEIRERIGNLITEIETSWGPAGPVPGITDPPSSVWCRLPSP